jgi:hypothetical protein
MAHFIVSRPRPPAPKKAAVALIKQDFAAASTTCIFNNIRGMGAGGGGGGTQNIQHSVSVNITLSAWDVL